jgi:hypothetical protein
MLHEFLRVDVLGKKHKCNVLIFNIEQVFVLLVQE